MNKHMVSVIIPMYNAASHIRECLESVLNQSYTSLEVIVIDDGSTDGSNAVVQRLIEKDNRIRYFYQSNRGVSSARNKGLQEARGDYITFVDADDRIAENFLEHALQLIQQYNADIVQGGTIKRYGSHDVICALQGEREHCYRGEEICNVAYKVMGYSCNLVSELNACFMSGSVCKLFSREVISGVLFSEKLVLGEDTVFNLQVLKRANCILVTSELWYEYYIDSESAAYSFRPDTEQKIKRLLLCLWELVGDDADALPFYYARVNESFIGLLYQYPLHPKSEMGFWRQCGYIQKLLKSPFWNDVYKSMRIRKLHVNRRRKIFGFAAKHRLAVLIVIMIYVSKWKRNCLKK